MIGAVERSDITRQALDETEEPLSIEFISKCWLILSILLWLFRELEPAEV